MTWESLLRFGVNFQNPCDVKGIFYVMAGFHVNLIESEDVESFEKLQVMVV